MPELRQDIVTGNWVVHATERAMRPTDFEVRRVAHKTNPQDCPFCPGNEVMTPLELFAVRPKGSEPNTPGWEVRVVPNKYPAFSEVEVLRGARDLFQRRQAEGLHEVIIHTPEHSLTLATMPCEKVELVLRVYRLRYHAASLDPIVRYVHIIVNHGFEGGASLEHSHSQLFGVPIIPALVQQELAGASWYEKSRGECVFCAIASKELEAGERVIFQSEHFVVIAPFASRYPFEVWIIPLSHGESYVTASDDELSDLAQVLKDVLRRFSDGFGDPPYNYYIHSAPVDGSEHPYYHWHIELMPRLSTIGSFEIGTQMMINTTTPEVAASFLSSL